MIKRVDERKQMSSASGEPKTPAGENDDIKVQHTPTYKMHDLHVSNNEKLRLN